MKLLLFMAVIMTYFQVWAAELPKVEVPNSEAFTGWRNQPYNVDEIDFSHLQTKQFNCANRQLEPLSQDQSTKKYHRFLIGTYDTSKLKGDSQVCLTSSSTNYCLRADTVQYAIMSDIYQDKCGNKYRGFWQILFLSGDESMGTLCSLGRTFYEKPNSEFPGDIEIGPTYPVDASKFIFFTELFPSDR